MSFHGMIAHFFFLLFSCSGSDSVMPWTIAPQASLSLTVSRSLLKFMSIESVIPSNYLILCHPLLLSIFPSIRVFSNELAFHIKWPKYWSFDFSISPSNEYSGLISFRCCVQLFVTPWTIAHQAPLSMGFPRAKITGMGCHFLCQGIFPTQGLNLCLLHWQADSLLMSHQGSPASLLLFPIPLTNFIALQWIQGDLLN